MGQINYHSSSSIDIKTVLKREDYGADFTSEEKVGWKNSTMEKLFQIIPAIPESVFGQLDNQSLVRCKEVGKNWFNFINAKKLPWIRIIKKYSGPVYQLPENWARVLVETPVETVKELAVAVQLFHIEFYLDDQWSPLHIVNINAFSNH